MSTGGAINKGRSDTNLSCATPNTIVGAFQKKRRLDEATTSSQSPTLQVNNVPLESVSNQTIISNPEYSREKEHLTFKLDKLNDKKARFESHEAYLTKSLTNNLIPNGLKVYVEPSIGNRDEEFLTQWYGRLDEFSRTLTRDVVGFCEQELSKTKEGIEATSKQLQDLLTENEYTKINEAIVVNQSIREKELSQRKNRKFYGLKYRNFNNRNTETRFNTPGQENNTRNDRTQDRGAFDHGNRRDFNNPGISYANAVSNNRPQQQTERTGNQGNQTKRSSYRNLYQGVRNTDPPNLNNIPLSERVSLHSRKNSRRNLQLNRENTTTDSSMNPRNREIEELRQRLNQLESKDNSPEKVIQHQVLQDAPPKNTEPAQRTNMGTNHEISEMKTFLANVMATIKDFDSQLTNQLNTGPTPPERS